MIKQQGLFLDRDGVINVNRTDNVRSWDQFEFEPDALAALSRLGASDLRVIVITNQSGIGRGHMTQETVEEIHERMVREIVQVGGRVDEVYYCPHVREDNCTCRKPSPEMLLRGRDRYDLDMSSSFFVGDWVDDVLAARGAGVMPMLVRTGRGERAIAEMKERKILLPEMFDNLAAAIDQILERLGMPEAANDR